MNDRPTSEVGLDVEGILPNIPADEKSENVDGLAERGQGGPLPASRTARDFLTAYKKDMKGPIIRNELIKVPAPEGATVWKTNPGLVSKAKKAGEKTTMHKVALKNGKVIEREAVLRPKEFETVLDRDYYARAGIPESVLDEMSKGRVLSEEARDALWAKKAEVMTPFDNEPKPNKEQGETIEHYASRLDEYYLPWTDTAQYRALVEVYLPMTKAYADKHKSLLLHSPLPDWASAYMDLQGAALAGTVEAVRRHDTSKGNKLFPAYLKNYVRASVLSEQAAMYSACHLPRELFAFASKVSTYRLAHQEQTGERPTDRQTAKALGVSLKVLQAKMSASRFSMSLSTGTEREDDYSGEEPEDQVWLNEKIADESIPPPHIQVEELEREEYMPSIRSLLGHAISLLSEKEAEAILRFAGMDTDYPDGFESIADLAAACGVHRSVMGRRINSALAKLRADPEVQAAAFLFDLDLLPLEEDEKVIKHLVPEQGSAVTTIRPGDYKRR